MEKDLLRVKKQLIEYINIIGKEYPYSKTNALLERMNDKEEIVEFSRDNSISFYVRNGVLYLPKEAYQFFPLIKEYKDYGKNKDNYRKYDEYLKTNTTYMDYIKHVIDCGLSVFDYFIESLLHEAMHLCGSGGGNPLEEGINELKTRELAAKYNIKIASYGYPKEVEIAKSLQLIIGKENMDDLTFIRKQDRKKFLTERVSAEVSELYELVSNKMIEKSRSYYDKFTKVSNPFEKANLYDNNIDYTEVNNIISEFNKNNKVEDDNIHK